MDLAFQMVMAVGVLAAMAVVILLLGRNRFRPFAEPSGGLGVEGQLALSPAHRLHVVRVDGGRYLIGTHAGGLSLIARLAEASPAASGGSGAASVVALASGSDGSASGQGGRS
jgi:flagellar biogenesis protein FliO